MSMLSYFKSVNKSIFSGHETFPLRYGWLKKGYDASCSVLEYSEDLNRDLFNNEEAISMFGVGKNMVASIKYWSIHCGIFDLDINTKRLSLTDFAHKILQDDGFDPWMENPATLWHIHWKLATNSALVCYSWLFNHCNETRFDKEYLLEEITSLVTKVGWKNISNSSITKDIGVLLRTYAPKKDKGSYTEENIESPLCELGLMSPLSKRDMFQLNRGKKITLSIETFGFFLFAFWAEYSSSAKTMTLENLTYLYNSPGKLLCLDDDAAAHYSKALADKYEDILDWSETAGLKQLSLRGTEINLNDLAYQFLYKNYQS